MKKTHLKTVKSKLPGIMPDLQKLLDDNGLKDFSIAELRLVHRTTDPCNNRCIPPKTCQQVIDDDGHFHWDCV